MMYFLAVCDTMHGAAALRRGPWGEGRRAGPPPRPAANDSPVMDARTEEAEQVRRAAAGDAEAFRRLTQRYYRPVGGFVLKRVRRPDLVEDLVQDTFLEAYRSLKAGRVPDCFS